VVARALHKLETLRNENWHPDFIFGCIRQFEYLGWGTYKCVESITNASLSKSWGTVTKFEHFIDSDDLVIDSELIDLKAKMLLERGDFYNVANYKKIIAHLESLRNPPEEEDAGLLELQLSIGFKVKVKEIISEEYKSLIERLSQTPLIKDKFLQENLGKLFENITKKINSEL
jgi:hypothetical protein